jgi:hypothetical protein
MSTTSNADLVASVQAMLKNHPREAVTIDLLRSTVQVMAPLRLQLGGLSAEQLNVEWVVAELVRRGAVWVEAPGVLTDQSDDHQHWLVPARKEGWRYTDRYLQWLGLKGLSNAAVDGIDNDTDEILKLLEDPRRPGPWDRRGLVVGHVQSGKTSNYTGLINKAADAGYKIIIVLAGLHNNLRSQTQQRLDEGFLGYESGPDERREVAREIGVGLLDRDPSIRPNFATNRTEKGDFSTAAARSLGVSPEQRPFLFVVKKNKTVLTRILKWLRDHVADTGRGADRRITHLPVLVVDDEADHASVDTAADAVDHEGDADPEHEPTAINRLIRQILSTFTRAAYVGYTATPFANIFIHERAKTDAEGRDLFPEAFIINLRAPSNYIGPNQVFGEPSEAGRSSGLPLVRCLDGQFQADFTPWLPQGHKNGQRPAEVEPHGVPESLAHAIAVFLLGVAVREARGEGAAHASMLVHVTRFQTVQSAVVRQIQEHLQALKQRLRRGIDAMAVWERFEEVWASDLVPTAQAVQATRRAEAGELPAWPAVVKVLPRVVQEVEVRTINGSAKDVLDYTDRQNLGLKVIAVGGDKLSRGLTLEGLTVSYFLRASRMYDTLMQMGRWFGYRTGYLELCRLYTPEELTRWFERITDAAAELREDFDQMVRVGGTPKDFGLRVQQHPSLEVTSAVKMRSGRELSVSFSGERLETVLFRNTAGAKAGNLDLLRELFGVMGEPSQLGDVSAPRPDGAVARWSGCRWDGVRPEAVVSFLRGYHGHPEAYKANGARLADFIEKMVALGELTEWTVACVGSRAQGPVPDFDLPLWPVRRAPAEPVAEDRLAIGILVSRRDEAIDLGADAWEAARQEDAVKAATEAGARRRAARIATAADDEAASSNQGEPLGTEIRWVRGKGDEKRGVPGHPERGLLLLYLIKAAGRDPDGELPPVAEPADMPPLEGDGAYRPFVGFALSFPHSTKPVVVKYKVNNLFWKQEVLGHAD